MRLDLRNVIGRGNSSNFGIATKLGGCENRECC